MFHLSQTRQEETGGEGPRERRMTDCYGAERRILGIMSNQTLQKPDLNMYEEQPVCC